MKSKVVGLDISKSTLDATIVIQGVDETWHDSFLNKEFGFSQLLKWVEKLAYLHRRYCFAWNIPVITAVSFVVSWKKGGLIMRC
jgi:hypothetical protein